MGSSITKDDSSTFNSSIKIQTSYRRQRRSSSSTNLESFSPALTNIKNRNSGGWFLSAFTKKKPVIDISTYELFIFSHF